MFVKYYDGLTGSLRASSPPMLVYSKGRLLIEALQCSNLQQKETGYYAKLRCGKHNYRTGLSADAVWTDLNYIFPADLSNEIQVIVKERCWSGDKVTGEINVPIADVVVQTKSDLAFVLRPSATSSSSAAAASGNNPITFSLRASPRPTQFDSRILIRCRVVPAHSETYDETMHSLRGGQPPRTTFLATMEEEAPARDRDAMSISSDDRPSTSSSSSSSSVSAKLPPGWEARVDRHGRVFYLDHANKRTTWEPPSPTGDADVPSVLESLKYSCARRTVVSKPSAASLDAYPLPVQFLLRTDFITLLQSNQAALKIYNNSVCLKHMLHRIRHDPTKFEQFEKNSELVTFLNLFADVTQPLPAGWQIAQHSQNRVLYIDHDSKKISLIDPRLPGEVKRRARSAPPARRRHMDLNGNIMDILTRTEEIKELVSKRLPELAPKICKKLQIISKMGEPGLLRFANDIDLITAISVLECEHQTVTSDFEDKLNYFYSSLQKSGYGQGPEKIRFRLRRSNLLNDAYEKMLAVSPVYLRRCIMTVAFDEEDGLDYGGPSRELFFLLSRELFNPQCGLFEYSANDSYTVQISPMSKFVDNFVRWFELAGRVLGLALIHRCLIDTFFTRAFYKFLLQAPFSISDLQSMDAQFYQSLLWVKEHPVSPELDLTFSATQDVDGEVEEKELVSNGRNIAVTEENKNEFLSLMVRWRIERGVEEQGKALLRGLYQVVDKEYLQVFDAEQLELVLAGTVEIDIEDWQTHTEYKGGYHEHHVVVAWFWSTVYAMSNADRLKLLQFVTGTSSIPCEGFKALRGSNGPRKFTIEKWGAENALPRAHTCFNRLDLPCYPTSQVLAAKLSTAINESSSYAIE
uniref:E3 ubiquitin-protein ligase n=2 Tax=Steinernema glaseri TaxID=37863 RepID=A0A1I8AKU0_9BILA